MNAIEWSRLVRTASSHVLKKLGEHVKRLVEKERNNNGNLQKMQSVLGALQKATEKTE